MAAALTPSVMSSMASPCDYDSDLSSLASTSPSPPPESRTGQVAYPSPPRSQDSSQSGSPSPDGDSMDSAANSEGPPRKKRRVSERQPRTTQYLDLRSGQLDDEDQIQLDRVLNVLHKHQKIVVVAGAGISVSAGIPDFRSSTGLFNSLRSEHNLKGSGKDLFDASHVYKDASSTSSFHDMVRSMSRMTKAASPTPFHHMLATLAQQDRLMRLYSQNVDGIDTAIEPLATCIPLKKNDEGKWPKTIQLHGGLDKMVCSKCRDLSDFNPELFDGPVPPVCQSCEETNRVRTEIAGKRSHGVGMLRPRMVLYNEHNPDDEAIGSVTRDDLRKRPDAVIVVGTTLKVPGVKRIVREMCATVRDRRGGVAIWINNDPEPSGKEFEDCWDIVVRGTCDEIARLAAMRKWDQLNESLEVTDEILAKAHSTKVEVVIQGRNALSITTNPTFKLPREEATPQGSPTRPVFTPMTSSRNSTFFSIESIEDSSIEDDRTIPDSPSKKAKSKNTTPKARTKNAFDALDSTKPRPAKTAKKAAATKSGVTKAATAAKKPPTKRAQPKITMQLKQTKAVSAAAAKDAKAGKGAAKSLPDPMRPLPAVDVRNNPSPFSQSVDMKSELVKAEEGDGEAGRKCVVA